MILIKQGQMGVIKTNCLGVLVVLLYVSFAVSLGYTKEKEEEEEEAFLDQLVDPATGKIDDHLAELLWTNCRQDLDDLKEAFKGPKLHHLEETRSTTNDIDTKSDPLAKESFQKSINVLHPQLKRALSDCIKRKKLLLQESGEDDGFKTCYPPNSESLFRWCEVSRRSLATESIAVDSASNLGPPSPRSPPPAPSLAHESPDSRSDLSLSMAYSTSPVTIHNFNRALREVDGHAEDGEGESEDADADHMKLVIIACVATAIVTSLIAIFFFFLCFRRKSGSAVNDESPLLSLRSETSGSSQAAKDSSLNKNASTNGNDYIESDALKISLDGKSSNEAVAAGAAQASSECSETPGNTGSQLPLPPGRVGASPGGVPPLKPPPGRADLLTPEPPAQAKAGPPPPPPPTNAGPRPPGPPPSPGAKPGPPPPPPPKGGAPPPPPPKAGGPPRPPPPLGSKAPKAPNALGRGGSGSGDSGKAKLKPFFWDKVSATPEQGQVWNQIKAGSFQFNEEKIETLFGYLPEKSKSEKKASTTPEQPQFIQLLDPKKAQNLSILLRALNVTSEEVSDALLEGNELPTELLQTLLKMAPTSEEELKLRLFNGEISQLGPAERFLKILVDIPHAYQKMETLQFMCSLHEELTATRESFQILETACKVLKSSRLFLKLLEAVLKTGNRMNDGTFRGGAQAFKLDTLLKLADVKGVDGKTTLLHFVVQEIIRTEGLRAARIARESKSFSSIKSEDLLEDVSPDTEEHYRSLGLQAVSNLSSDLEYVKKAAALDAESLTGTVAKIGHAMVKTRNFLNTEMKDSDEKSGFHETLKDFVQNAEADVMSLLQEEKRIMELVKSTGDYFHGNVKKDEGLRLFTVVRDFLVILDKVCREVKNRKPAEAPKKQASNASSSSESHVAPPSPDPRQKLSHAISQQKVDDSSSDSSSDEKSKKPAEAPKKQVSNASSSSESRVAPPSPDPRQKLAHAISQQRVDESSSDSSSDEKSSKTAEAPKKQVPNASSSSKSRVVPPSPDPRQKLAHAISQQRVDDSSSDSSSDEKSSKPAEAPKKQVSNVSSSSESRVVPPSPDPRQKLAHAISQQRVDDSSSDSSSDEKS